jgi:hypothetical protein
MDMLYDPISLHTFFSLTHQSCVEICGYRILVKVLLMIATKKGEKKQPKILTAGD